MEKADSSVVYTPEVIASVFVGQYYEVFFTKRDVIQKFYEDSSKITRQNLDGVMSSASTLQGINEILSLEYLSEKVEIFSIDAQQSCNDGIIVVVTGFLIGESEKKRSFIQTFFLAKHETGYYVLNDIFRFGIGETLDIAADIVADTEVPVIDVATPLVEEENHESTQVSDQQAEVKQPELVPESHSVENRAATLKQLAVSKPTNAPSEKPTQELPKMSYASMLAKQSPVSSPVKRAAHVVVVAPSANSSLDKMVPAAPKEKTPATEKAPPQRRNNAPPAPRQVPPQRRNNAAPPAPQKAPTVDTSRDGKSIYVGNLPPHIPVEELDKEFSKFGQIKKDGIQVRTYSDNFCYGFVEFESLDSAREAVKAHTVWFGTFKSYITEKKSLSRGSDNNGNNRRSRENSAEGKNGGDFAQNRGTNNRNRSTSFQNQKSGVVGEQKQGVKPAPTASGVKPGLAASAK